MKLPNTDLTNKILFAIPAAIGAIAILWVAGLFIGTNALALLVTLLIAIAFGIGVVELFQFRKATDSLEQALGNIPQPINQLDEWLSKVHHSLQNPVRLRIESERVGLPAPVLTPYLVGLLVMLGLLGTFIGMVDTLGGAVTALQGSTELQAIRQGLTAPINGLSLAFGTSVAGVAASAMLGLMSTLSRRERMLATRALDAQIATQLRSFSITHNRQQTFQALQAQAELMPALSEQLQTIMQSIAQTSTTLNESLLANQKNFQDTVHSSFTELAKSVHSSLNESLIESSTKTNANISAMVSDQLTALASESETTQQRIGAATEQQLAAITGQLQGTTSQLNSAWQENLHAQQASTSAWMEHNQTRMEQLTSSVAEQVATLGKTLEEPLAQLITASSETPKAAAEVIGELRKEIANNVERDKILLEERKQVFEQLATMSKAFEAGTAQQHESMNQLLQGSSTALSQAGSQFSQHISTELEKLGSVTEHFEASAINMDSLGESFASAVAQYSQSNEQLVQQLNRIEQSMDTAGNRSDQQMSYYVAQAREIIDQSLLSQKELFDELRQVSSGEPEQSDVSEASSTALN
ncbi:MAG: hypothetical protein AB8B48_14970 [Pseudomonadales bacterium]